MRTSLTHRSAGGHRLPRSTSLRESAFNPRLKRGARNSLGGYGWSHQRRRSAVRADSHGLLRVNGVHTLGLNVLFGAVTLFAPVMHGAVFDGDADTGISTDLPRTTSRV